MKCEKDLTKEWKDACLQIEELSRCFQNNLKEMRKKIGFFGFKGIYTKFENDYLTTMTKLDTLFMKSRKVLIKILHETEED